MKTLKIAPDGHLVSGGELNYDFKEDGTVSFKIHIIVHYLFSDHHINEDGVYKVDPQLLKSANLKIGQSFSLGSLTLKITGKSDKFAMADVDIKDLGEGTAQIGLSNKLIELVRLTAAGSVLGQSVKLVTV